MADVMTRLTIHDQLLINLCGWVVCDAIKPSDNFGLIITQLRRTIPNANPDHPLIAPLIDAAGRVVTAAKDWRSLEYSSATWGLRTVLQTIFMARAAQAAAAIWPDENSQPMEPAHAAE